MTAGMTIAVGTLADQGGGITRVGRMTVRALTDLGEEPGVIGLLDKAPLAFAGRRVTACGGSRLAFAAGVARAALTSEAIIYDSVGLSRAHPPLLGTRCAGITWVHGVEVWEALSPKYARAIGRMGLVIANSRYTLARHERLHGKLPRARVCELATEHDDGPRQLADFSGPPTVLIVGRIDATEGFKGHTELLAAWPEVSAAVPGARLVIAGGGSGLEDIRRRAAGCGTQGSIEVAGFVPDDRLPDLYGSAHVFAMPSRQEGFGIAYVEAMRYGLPVVASLQDAGQEVNVDGVTGFNVDLDRRGQLARRLIELLSSPDTARRFGTVGARRWHEHYRYSHFKARLAAIWHEVREHETYSATGTRP